MLNRTKQNKYAELRAKEEAGNGGIEQEFEQRNSGYQNSRTMSFGARRSINAGEELRFDTKNYERGGIQSGRGRVWAEESEK